MSYNNYEENYAENHEERYRINQGLEVKAGQFVNAVYGWMFLAMLLTAGISYITATNPALFGFTLKSFYILMLLELGLVWGIGLGFNKLSSMGATIMFFVYSAINGLTLTPILLMYTGASVFITFMVCAAMFGTMSLIGLTTKKNLDGIGRIAIMGLIGIIIASIANWFIGSSSMDFIITYLGVVIFVALTAYDNQKIKQIGMNIDINSPYANKYAVYGALTLYLDFINLFLFLLRIMGRRK